MIEFLKEIDATGFWSSIITYNTMNILLVLIFLLSVNRGIESEKYPRIFKIIKKYDNVIIAPALTYLVVIFTSNVLHEFTAMMIYKNYSSPIHFTIISLITSIFLFLLRREHRILYGILEILVGVAAQSPAWPRATTDSELVQHGLVLAGGIYIVIRGLSNIEDGWKERGAKKGSRANR